MLTLSVCALMCSTLHRSLAFEQQGAIAITIQAVQAVQ